MKEEAIERVMELIKPTRRLKECTRQVRFSIDLIAQPMPDLVPIGAVKKQLRHLATALIKARTAIKMIPDDWNGDIYEETTREAFILHLSQVEHASQQLEEKLNVKRSGGAASARREAKRARIAAKCAFDILNDWGGQAPTLTASGPYFRLTSLLFEIATDQQERDMSRACADYMEELRDDGFPHAEELRRMRRAWKQEPPPPDHILAASKGRNSKK